MEVLFNKQNDLLANITIKLSPEDYSKDYEKQLEQYKKQVNMPGFRPGKVPTAVIKKRYGKGILAEHINQTVNQELSKYIQENELNYLGNPILAPDSETELNFDEPSDYAFNFELGLSPEVNIDLAAEKNLPYYRIKADEDMLERQISDMTRRYGKLSEPDKAGENDMLIGDIVELENGEVKESGIFNQATITLEFIEDEDFKKTLVGLAAGDSCTVDIDKVSKSPEDKAKMLGISADDAEQYQGDFRFNIKEIKRLVPAELNQEFFDKLYEGGTVTSEEEFKARVREELERGFIGDADKLFRKKMMETLIEKADLALPDDFLKRWIKTVNEKPLSDEELEREYPMYATQLKEQLIENHLVKSNNIQIEAADVEHFIANSIRQQYTMYGINIPDAELKNHVASLMQNEQERNKYVEGVVQQKVLDFAKNEVKLAEKEVSYTEFIELMYPKSAK